MQCNCGATLPEDARFCHKCGKPQYESDIARLQEHTREENSGGAATSESALAGMQQPAPFGGARTAPPPLDHKKIDFSNRRALMISVVVACLTLFCFTACSVLVPFAASLLILPLFCFSGFVAARLYIRQTGEVISTQSGARLGFMTALWAFLVVVILCVLLAIFISNPELRGEIVDKLTSQGNPATQQIVKMLNDPRRFILLMMGELLVNFCLFTFPSMLGGMLGVRFGAKR